MDTRTKEEKVRDFADAVAGGATIMAHPDTLREAPQRFLNAGMSPGAVCLLFAKTIPHPYLMPGELYAVKIRTREETVNMLTKRFDSEMFSRDWMASK